MDSSKFPTFELSGVGPIYGKACSSPLKVKMGFDLILGLQSGLILAQFDLEVICFDFDFDFEMEVSRVRAGH